MYISFFESPKTWVLCLNCPHNVFYRADLGFSIKIDFLFVCKQFIPCTKSARAVDQTQVWDNSPASFSQSIASSGTRIRDAKSLRNRQRANHLMCYDGTIDNADSVMSLAKYSNAFYDFRFAVTKNYYHKYLTLTHWYLFFNGTCSCLDTATGLTLNGSVMCVGLLKVSVARRYILRLLIGLFRPTVGT